MRVNIFLLIVAVVLLGNFITAEDAEDFEKHRECSKKLLHKLNPFGISNKFSVCSKGWKKDGR